MPKLETRARSCTAACVVEKRLTARAIKRILDRQSRELVGWLYEWNTGEQEPMWKDQRYQDIIYEQRCAVEPQIQSEV